jgi:hypothetical protein
MHINMALTMIKLAIRKQKQTQNTFKKKYKRDDTNFGIVNVRNLKKEHKFKRNSLLKLQDQFINEFSKLD